MTNETIEELLEIADKSEWFDTPCARAIRAKLHEYAHEVYIPRYCGDGHWVIDHSTPQAHKEK